MKAARFLTGTVSAALLLAGSASAEEWFDAYDRGLLALEQGQPARAVASLERAIRLRPEPGMRLITYGTNRLDEYYPYLRLAEAHLLAGSLEAARDALKRSAARGKEPATERGRIAQRLDAAEAVRRASAAPLTTVAAASPPPTSLASAPVLPTPSAAPATAPPISVAAPPKPPVRRESSPSPVPASSVASAAPPPSAVPATFPSPSATPAPVSREAEPGFVFLGLLVMGGVAVWVLRARARAAEQRAHTRPAAPAETRALTGIGLPGAGEPFGPYRLIAPLGKGGMAAVFKAERNGETYALKRPLAAFLDEPEFLERFLREAEIGRTLHHPNIVRIHERGDVDGVPYFAMELVKGRTLQEFVRERGALEPRVAAKVVAQVAEALDYAHLKGVIHRDLKPSNIMILDDGAVKVMDYGIARARRFDGLTIAGTFLGTPEYAAPETAQGQPSDPRSDLYSLGVVFYELVTGRKPFLGDTPFVTLQKQCTEAPAAPSVLAPSTPRPLEAMILRLLSKDAANRYPGAEELLIELRDYLNRAD